MAVSIGFACVAMTAGLISAQEAKATIPPGRDRRSDDAVWAAARREAEAKKREMEANFARLRVLPAVQPGAQVRLVEREDVLAVMGLLSQVQERDGRDVDAPYEEGPAPPRFVVAEGLVDRVLFASRNQEWVLSHYDALLTSRVESADRKWRLTPGERDKLRLAGQGDVKRFIDRVDAKRREFMRVRADLERCRQLVRELVPLRGTVNEGPFGEGSIFSKVLKRIADERGAAKR